MKKLSLIFCFVNLVFGVFSQEITGSWLGTLNIQGSKLRVGFNIEQKDSVLIAKLDSPDQGAMGLPTNKTTFKDNKLEIVATGLGIFYQGTLQADSIVGTFNQGGMSFPLTLQRTEKPTLNRPQTPQPPFPYKSEEVTFSNKKAKIDLSGTLTLPDSAGTFPAAILIAGSGPNDRDEAVFGHKPFLVIADYLTQNGFAVLRYDKRGVGHSKGDYAKATIQDFAEDATAALNFLKTRKEIDKSRIGLIGHSEGGMVAPMVASQNKSVNFVVLMAAPGVKGTKIVLEQNRLSLGAMNMEAENLEKSLDIVSKILNELTEWNATQAEQTVLRDQLSQLWEQLPLLVKLKLKKEPFVREMFNQMTKPGYRSFLKVNPAEYLQKVKCPVLAINGEEDTQVNASANLKAIHKALQKAANNEVEIKSYPKLNHLFQECETGNIDEYGKIEQTISTEVLEDMVEWLKQIDKSLR